MDEMETIDVPQAFRPGFRPAVLDALRRFGIVPREDTDPQRLRGLLNDLYVFQIRDLKLQHEEMEKILGPQPISEYRHRLLRLKTRYSLLTVPLDHWRESPRPSLGPPSPPPLQTSR